MDKSLLMYRGGVRSVVRKLVDGQDHTLHFKARTPNEMAAFFGSLDLIEKGPKGNVDRQKIQAAFIADALCNEDGTQLMTPADAELIPGSLKVEICAFITTESNKAGTSGND
jgi:hypothetical protein